MSETETSISLSKKLAHTLSESVTNFELAKNAMDHEGWKKLQSEQQELNTIQQQLEQLKQARNDKAQKARLERQAERRTERRAEKARLMAETGHGDEDDDELVSDEAMKELEEAKSQLEIDRWNFENDKFQFEVLQAQLGGIDSVSVAEKSYMIAARDLDIRFGPIGEKGDRCQWISVPETRYAVAEMLETNFFQIYGRIDPSTLFPYTNYAAYFIYNFQKDTIMDGFDFSYGEGGAGGIGDENNQILINNIYLVSKEDQAGGEDADVYPTRRSDGWMEVELGSFFVKGDEEGEEVQLSMIEIWSGVVRKGLMVLGMELRPIQK